MSYIFIAPDVVYSRYRVAGVVEFSYRSFETKTGDNVTSSQEYWTQAYQANLSGHVLDSRLMTFVASAGYRVHTYITSGSDISSVNYSIHTNFFPDMKVS